MLGKFLDICSYVKLLFIVNYNILILIFKYWVLFLLIFKNFIELVSFFI